MSNLHSIWNNSRESICADAFGSGPFAVPPLEGFVMNRVQGDYFETLLYKIFVSIDEQTNVSEVCFSIHICRLCCSHFPHPSHLFLTHIFLLVPSAGERTPDWLGAGEGTYFNPNFHGHVFLSAWEKTNPTYTFNGCRSKPSCFGGGIYSLHSLWMSINKFFFLAIRPYLVIRHSGKQGCFWSFVIIA